MPEAAPIHRMDLLDGHPLTRAEEYNLDSVVRKYAPWLTSKKPLPPLPDDLSPLTDRQLDALLFLYRPTPEP